MLGFHSGCQSTCVGLTDMSSGHHQNLLQKQKELDIDPVSLSTEASKRGWPNLA